MDVIQMSREQFSQWCESFGYTIDEAVQCVVSNDGSVFTVNLASPFFPRSPKPGFMPQPVAMVPPDTDSSNGAGPGTELHLLLGRFGLTASGDCKCKSRVSYMNRMEAEQPGWAEANIEEVVGWLRESAAERGLPFLDIAARVLVRRAIANARRKAAADATRSPHHDRGEAVAPPLHDAQG